MSNYHQYGYTQEGKVYLKGYAQHPDRQIGVVKESPEESLKYFADRYDHLLQKIEEMEAAVEESQNKGSYLMKLIHLRQSLDTYNALGDFPALIERLNALERFIQEYIEQNRTKNLEIKKNLLQEAQTLVKGQDWETVAEQLKELKMRWIRTGSTHEEEELCQEFDHLLDDFFERRKNFYEDLKNLTDKRMTAYRNLIRALKDINKKKTNEAEDRREVIRIQKEWKDVGRINKWRYLKLWKKYKREIDLFFGNENSEGEQPAPTPATSTRNPTTETLPRRRRRIGEAVSTPQRIFSTKVIQTPEGILARKEEICQEVEEILNGSIHTVSLDAIKERQNEWRVLGMVQYNEKDKQLNIQFRSVCNEIFEHYNLYKFVRSSVDGFVQKTRFEQLKIKIRVLKEFIKQEETELARMPAPSPTNNDPRDKSRLQYINKINKVKTQKRMLRKMQQELDSDFY